ncbi:hypothetical protein [Streptomyces qaidamensis]|uniref:hypothetical protein n=1 Tax=Streptomyces qaidamensis TaxID=1783515 RepID=UPI000A5EC601|nr:hypothetical protein [Streptomyces qaidamensis]
MKVRTTMQPHLDIEVTEAERLDLQRQGLLLPDEAEGDSAQATDKTTDAKASQRKGA